VWYFKDLTQPKFEPVKYSGLQLRSEAQPSLKAVVLTVIRVVDICTDTARIHKPPNNHSHYPHGLYKYDMLIVSRRELCWYIPRYSTQPRHLLNLLFV
jgi:hypothetical protein